MKSALAAGLLFSLKLYIKVIAAYASVWARVLLLVPLHTYMQQPNEASLYADGIPRRVMMEPSSRET